VQVQSGRLAALRQRMLNYYLQRLNLIWNLTHHPAARFTSFKIPVETFTSPFILYYTRIFFPSRTNFQKISLKMPDTGCRKKVCSSPQSVLFQIPYLEIPFGLPLLVLGCDVPTLVIELLASCQGDLNLDLAALEIDLDRNQSITLLLDLL
jgi:hypothetical protein